MPMRFTAVALVLLAACGGSHAKPADPPSPTTWKDMNADQRKKFMEDVVMPKAKEVFVAFDAEKYQDLDCKTCHGPGADDGSFELPNPAIAPLPNTPEAFQAKMAADPDFQRFTPFMAQKVEPMMAELLQLTPFDPATMTGEFGCANCHQLVDGAGAIVKMPEMPAK